jgi:NADPH:quinone reductase
LSTTTQATLIIKERPDNIKNMRAVTLKAFGGIENMVVSHVAKPVVAAATDVLIRVKAAGINRGDLMQRKGNYPPPPGASEIMGLEAAGIVEALGDSVTSVKVGDSVMCLLSGGGYAEYVVASQGSVMPIPAGFTFTEAAAIPEVFLTAWQCLKFNADVQRGDRVLVHAGASGVGTAASQLVERVIGGVAITTSSENKVEGCKAYATYAVSRTPNEETGKVFADKVAAALGDAKGVQAIIDPVFGGQYLAEDGEAMAVDGVTVVLAFMGGNVIKEFNGTPFFRKRATVRFSTLRSRSEEYKSKLVKSFCEEALPYFSTPNANGLKLESVINTVLALEDVTKGHALLEANDTSGKVILTL